MRVANVAHQYCITRPVPSGELTLSTPETQSHRHNLSLTVHVSDNIQLLNLRDSLFSDIGQKQEPQLLLRKSRSYLLIYSFKRKSAFDACLC